MGEITNEHRIGGLEARMHLMEQSHLRLETRIENHLKLLGDRMDGLFALVNAGKGVRWTITAIGGALGWVVGIAAILYYVRHMP